MRRSTIAVEASTTVTLLGSTRIRTGCRSGSGMVLCDTVTWTDTGPSSSSPTIVSWRVTSWPGGGSGAAKRTTPSAVPLAATSIAGGTNSNTTTPSGSEPDMR